MDVNDVQRSIVTLEGQISQLQAAVEQINVNVPTHIEAAAQRAAHEAAQAVMQQMQAQITAASAGQQALGASGAPASSIAAGANTTAIGQTTFPTNPPGAPSMTSFAAGKTKVNAPVPFDGNRSKLRDFLTQVGLNFRANPIGYQSDGQKITFIGSYLSGSPLGWFTSLMESESPLLDDYDGFVAALKSNFGDSDERSTAERNILKLRQKGSAAKYATDFRLVADKTKWNDAAKMTLFYMGLNDSIKNMLLNLPKRATLEELITDAITCDNRIWEVKNAERTPATTDSRFGNPFRPRMNPQGSSASSAASNPTTLNGPVPMDLSSTQVFKKLTPEERARRLKEHLCMYCGQPDHIAAKCPIKPATPPNNGQFKHKLNATEQDPDKDKQSGNGQGSQTARRG